MTYQGHSVEVKNTHMLENRESSIDIYTRVCVCVCVLVALCVK